MSELSNFRRAVRAARLASEGNIPGIIGMLHDPGTDRELCSQMGVGDGTGRLFVYGTGDAIRAAQAIVDERNELRNRVKELEGGNKGVFSAG